MSKWTVHGTTTVGVTVTVEADDEESAVAAAHDTFTGLTAYAGNGGTDQLVGVNDSDVSLSPSDDFEVQDVVIDDEAVRRG